MARLRKMPRSTLKMTLKILFLIIGIVNLDLCGGVRGDNLTTTTKTTAAVEPTTTTTRTTIIKKITKAVTDAAGTTTTTTTTATATPPTQSVASTQTYLPAAKLGSSSSSTSNPTRLRIQQCREGCYKMFLSNGVPCQQSRECLACWSECMKPPPLSSPYPRKLKWYGATWSLSTVSMVQQDSLVLVEVAWQPLRWPNQCLVTWEVSGGGLMGNLLTESCNVQLSLWPDTKYRVQVTCKNKLTGDMSRSQPLMVDTAKAAKSPKTNNNNNHLLRRQHSAAAATAADDEATATAIQQEEAAEEVAAASVDQFPAENIAPILPYDEDDDIDNDGNNIDVAVQSAAEQQMNKHTNFIFNWHTHNNGNMAAAAAAAAAVDNIEKKKNKNADNAAAVDNADDDDDSAPADDNDDDDDENNKDIDDNINNINDDNEKDNNGIREKQHAFNMLSLATSIDMQKPLLFCLIAGSLLLLALVLLMCLLCRVRRSPDDKAALLRDDAEVSSLDEDDDDYASAIGVSLPPILAIIAADGCKTNRLSDLRHSSSTALKV